MILVPRWWRLHPGGGVPTPSRITTVKCMNMFSLDQICRKENLLSTCVKDLASSIPWSCQQYPFKILRKFIFLEAFVSLNLFLIFLDDVFCTTSVTMRWFLSHGSMADSRQVSRQQHAHQEFWRPTFLQGIKSWRILSRLSQALQIQLQIKWLACWLIGWWVGWLVGWAVGFIQSSTYFV